MNPETTIAELLRLWPRLPDLTGAHWPALYWQLIDLLRAFRHAASDEQRAGVAIRVVRLLATVSDVRAAWAADSVVHERGDGTRTPGGVSASPIARDEVWAAVEDLLQPQPVTRWTDVLAPARVATGQRFAVIAGLTRRPTAGDESKPIETLPGQAVRVVIAATEFEVVGERAKELRVTADRECEPGVFYLRAPSPGCYGVVLDFWVDQQVAASVSLSVLAEETPDQPAGAAEPTGTIVRPAVGVPVGPVCVPHPDLILRVTTADNRLRFDLDFADTRFVQIVGERLRADPETFRYNLLEEIEGLAAQRGQSQDFLVRQVEKIGQRLYRELFPAELRREYRQFSRDVNTLQIVSDEPWIPWELIKPYDDETGQELLDHDFLCLQFELARWVCPAANAPATEIAVDSVACIAPSDSELPYAQQEKKELETLAQSLHWHTHSPDPADLKAVEELLRGDQPIRLWHFACHGDFNRGVPGKSPLYLENNSQLPPDDIVGPAQTHLKRDQPLVFLNACRAGTGGLSITGLDGWASVLVRNCGVGALIAPMWSVSDRLACEFSRVFYDRLQREPGCTIAIATRTARRHLREDSPHNPTWLAYSLYAHPNARVKLAKS